MFQARSTIHAIQHALLERARPAQLLRAQGPAHHVHQVQSTYMLLDLFDVIGKLGKSRGDAFKVKMLTTGASSQPTLLGQRLLECLPAIANGLSTSSVLTFHPRLRLAIEVARSQGLAEWILLGGRDWLRQDPWAATNRLNDLVDQIRRELNSRAFMHVAQRQKEKHAKRLKDLESFFKSLVARHPAARVLRLELRISQYSI